ncbi:MAG TPA: glycosyltransferase [Acidocella sp.]|nr:glycosyltransferase [Acidocella sp.]HQU03894.1 glycosyltransferase [Acidocella sp.]
MLYSHDTFGLGHLRRNLAIAVQLLSHPEHFSVTLLTGSPVISQWNLPHGLRVEALPPVVKIAAETYAPRDGQAMFGLVKGYREALILKRILHDQPDIFLVDHAPAGMNGELLSALALMRRELPQTRVILGLRDILDSPETVRSVWAAQEIMDLLAQAYDDIFVYGSEALFDVVEGYGITGAIAQRVRYCGHVVAAPEVDTNDAEAGVCWNPAAPAGRPVVLVSAGGGGDGFPMMQAYLQALQSLPPNLAYSVIVKGPLMAPDEKAVLRKLVAGREDVELVSHTMDLVPSLRAAHLAVAMAGYNTSAEIIATRTRAILVPRPGPRAEQLLRARLLAKLGVVRNVEPGENLVARLAASLTEALAAPPPAAACWEALDLNGADYVATQLATMMQTQCEPVV